MRKILAIVAVLAVSALADPVACSQVSDHVINGVPKCRCIIHNIETESDTIFRRNIVQYCPVDKGRFWTSLQVKLPRRKWITYENMDCAVLDDENVSCRSLNKVEENPDFKYLSPKLEVFYLFMYDTYGTKNVNYLLNIKK